MARKAGVDVGGTGLIAAGIPLIPLPGPGDFMVVGGLALLATEFPQAQIVLDGTRDKLAEVLEKNDNDVDENEEDDGANENHNAVEEAAFLVQKQAEALAINIVMPMLNTVRTIRLDGSAEDLKTRHDGFPKSLENE